MFQEDLYPPFASNEPSNDFATWATGTDNPVKTMQLRPFDESAASSNQTNNLMSKLGKSSQGQASAQQDDAKVKELEAKISQLNHDLESTKATLSQAQTALEQAQA